jgi:hypothetical protein
MHEQAVTGGLEGSQVIQDSWRTGEWAWWMFAGFLVEVFARRTDLAGEQTEAEQTTLGSVEVQGTTLKCWYGIYWGAVGAR